MTYSTASTIRMSGEKQNTVNLRTKENNDNR